MDAFHYCLPAIRQTLPTSQPLIDAIHPSRFLAAVALLFAFAGLAQGTGPYDTTSDGADPRLMLKGHDPVTYFTAGKPMLGDPGIQDGLRWRHVPLRE